MIMLKSIIKSIISYFDCQNCLSPVSLDLEKIFVPLKLSPESASKISEALIQRQKKEGKLELWNLLEKKLDRNSIFKPIAIIGEPGTGKTTLMEHIVIVHSPQLKMSQLYPCGVCLEHGSIR